VRWKILQILFVTLSGMLVACSTPPTATIPPSPVPIWVSYSPYLAGIQEAVQACTLENPQVAIFFEQVPGAQQEFDDHDLVIWWGDKPEQIESAYQIGVDELVVITNPENPKPSLNQEQVIALFSGRIENWNEIGLLDEQVEVWIFPEENLMTLAFQEEILNNQRITRLARLAPASQAMRDAVGDEPGAIGFLPRSWLDEQVKEIEIDAGRDDAVRKPLLALAASDPPAAVNEVIACLQSGAGQEILSGYYGLTN
jgi:hypothetical protein